VNGVNYLPRHAWGVSLRGNSEGVKRGRDEGRGGFTKRNELLG
jgi:hypothetical protein